MRKKWSPIHSRQAWSKASSMGYAPLMVGSVRLFFSRSWSSISDGLSLTTLSCSAACSRSELGKTTWGWGVDGMNLERSLELSHDGLCIEVRFFFFISVIMLSNSCTFYSSNIKLYGLFAVLHLPWCPYYSTKTWINTCESLKFALDSYIGRSKHQKVVAVKYKIPYQRDFADSHCLFSLKLFFSRRTTLQFFLELDSHFVCSALN